MNAFSSILENQVFWHVYFIWLNLKKYKKVSSVNILMTQKCIFNLAKSILVHLEMKNIRFKHVFLNTCTDKIKIYHV